MKEGGRGGKSIFVNVAVGIRLRPSFVTHTADRGEGRAGRQAGRQAGWLAGWLAGWPAGWLAGWPASIENLFGAAASGPFNAGLDSQSQPLCLPSLSLPALNWVRER